MKNSEQLKRKKEKRQLKNGQIWSTWLAQLVDQAALGSQGCELEPKVGCRDCLKTKSFKKKAYSQSNFQIYNTVFLTIVTMLYITSPRLIL